MAKRRERDPNGIIFNGHDIGIGSDRLGNELYEAVYELATRVSPDRPYVQETAIEPYEVTVHDQYFAMLTHGLRIQPRSFFLMTNDELRHNQNDPIISTFLSALEEHEPSDDPTQGAGALTYARRNSVVEQHRRLARGSIMTAMQETMSSMPELGHGHSDIVLKSLGIVAVLGKYSSPKRLMVYPEGSSTWLLPHRINGVPRGYRYNMQDPNVRDAAQWAIDYASGLINEIDK